MKEGQKESNNNDVFMATLVTIVAVTLGNKTRVCYVCNGVTLYLSTQPRWQQTTKY